MKKVFYFVCMSFLLSCATTRKTPQAPTTATNSNEKTPAGFHGGKATALPPGIIIDAKTGKEVSFERMINVLAPMDGVYVGEIHNDKAQHEAQLWVLKGLFYARPGTIAIGMEMFQRPFQGAIDLYLQGEIGEKALIRETEYESRWGYDFGYYRPLLRFALDHGVPVLALNASTELVRKISSVGLEGLSAAEKEALPEMDFNDTEHRRRVEKAFSQHPHGGSVERFYTIQTLWDETMADSVATFLKPYGRNQVQMIVFAGRAHVAGGFGIPNRVARRLPGEYKIVVPISIPKGEKVNVEELLQENLGDYLWVLEIDKTKTKSPHGKMGGKSPHGKGKKSPHGKGGM